jgi:hypothetical protein
MSYKLMPRLGSAIATTILSLFSGVLLVGVDKAQAAVLTYNIGDSRSVDFFKVSNSSLTGIGLENIAVSEGRFYGFTASFNSYPLKGKDYYDLAGATALFYQGEFVGLNASGYDRSIREINFPADESHGPSYVKYVGWADWSIASRIISGLGGYRPLSLLSGYKEVIINDRLVDRSFGPTNYSTPVSYTLVDTEPEPVPEPLTAGGTALALAGLSWLKHKKKTAA